MITAGAALSLSGRFAEQGNQAARGLTLWAAQVNGAGGLRLGADGRRHTVSLHIYDDASRRNVAAAQTERLIVDDRVDLLFSPYSSVLALAAAEVAQRYGRTLWNHGGSSDALTSRDRGRVVTLLTPASQYAEPVVRFAAAQARALALPLPTMALLYGPTGTFPRSVAAGARTEAERLGLVIVVDQPYPAADDEWPALMTSMHARRPGIILGAGATEADIRFARELRRQSALAPVTALVAAPIEAFQVALGSDADGFCGPSQWEPTADGPPDLGPSSAAFAAAFREQFAREADYPAAQAFAAGLLAAHCAEQAGVTNDAALWDAARRLDLTNCYGRFRIDASGQQVGHGMMLIRWQDGRKRVVWPEGVGTVRT